MTRLFLPPEKLASEQIIITGDQARHLSLVLKVKPGDPLTIFDGLGYKYDCRIMQTRKKEISVELISRAPYSVESPISITLAQGITKGDKMDFIIQKTTELGVRNIIPVITERSQVRHTHKTDRWRRIALSSSQQSGRDRIPEVMEPVTLHDFLDQQIPASARGYIEDIKGVELGSQADIVFSEHKKEINLKQILSGLKDINKATVLIGPEGGFSKEEISAALEKGFIEASLGPRTLRTETAPVAAISIIQYELGDVG